MKLRRKHKKVEPISQDSLLKKQSERIEELKKENYVLSQQLESYRKKEKEIADTVVFARQKQEEFIGELRVRYALENERLRRFCETMDCYKSREELMSAYDRSFSAVKKAREELSRMLTEDLGTGASEYLSERKRLGVEDSPFDEQKRAERDLNKVTSLTEEELQDLLDQI